MKWPPQIPNWLLLALAGALLVLAFSRFGSGPSRADAERSASATSPGVVDSYFYERLGELENRLAEANDSAHDRVEYALLLHDAHRHPEAAAELERYLAAQPDDREAWLHLANVYGATDRWDEAERVSHALLHYFPDDPAGLYNLGATAANRGRYDEARRWWSALAENGDDEALRTQATSSLAQLASLESRSDPEVDRNAGRGLPPGHPPVGRQSSYLQARQFSAAN